ncbi:MAG: hypothetical protein ACR2LK_05120 [Solirubrobacteraceae bacterium]
MRPENLVGHYGDDVFVVIARDVADEASSHKVAARLTRALELLEGLAEARVALILDHRAADPPATSDVANLPISTLRLDRSSITGDPVKLGELMDGHEPVVELGAPAVP